MRHSLASEAVVGWVGCALKPRLKCGFTQKTTAALMCDSMILGCPRCLWGPSKSNQKHLHMMELISNPQAWIAFATLTALELVLGIDNIIFISILVDKLPKEKREFARRVGLFMAMFMRIGLLLVLAWIVGLVAPLFTVLGQDISGRDLILIAGGLFLIYKSTGEIHQSLEGEEEHGTSAVKATLTAVILQIMVIDLVFSLDSIITAVGMVDDVRVMIAAVIVSVALMMLFAGPIGRFVSDHPTIKMLALAFLVVVGVVLVAEGFGHHVPKGYIYFGMAFSLGVELLNIRLRKKSKAAVHLHPQRMPGE
jgi:predicted tellurium resistance membrane protein TerC